MRSEEKPREVGVTEIVERVRETRMRWYGQVQRIENTDQVKTKESKDDHGKSGRVAWVGLYRGEDDGNERGGGG